MIDLQLRRVNQDPNDISDLPGVKEMKGLKTKNCVLHSRNNLFSRPARDESLISINLTPLSTYADWLHSLIIFLWPLDLWNKLISKTKILPN